MPWGSGLPSSRSLKHHDQRGGPDGIKYDLFLVKPNTDKVVFGIDDNHKPKGPRLHLNGREVPYGFTSVDIPHPEPTSHFSSLRIET